MRHGASPAQRRGRHRCPRHNEQAIEVGQRDAVAPLHKRREGDVETELLPEQIVDGLHWQRRTLTQLAAAELLEQVLTVCLVVRDDGLRAVRKEDETSAQVTPVGVEDALVLAIAAEFPNLVYVTVGVEVHPVELEEELAQLRMIQCPVVVNVHLVEGVANHLFFCG